MESLLVTGFLNPALCALAYMRAMNVPTNEESFYRIANVCGDADLDVTANGFLVQDMGDVQKLCEIGSFVIALVDGVATCMTPDEWSSLK